MKRASALRAALQKAADDGLSFFLDFTTSSGGAWEQTGDTVMVLLPEALGRHLAL